MGPKRSCYERFPRHLALKRSQEPELVGAFDAAQLPPYYAHQLVSQFARTGDRTVDALGIHCDNRQDQEQRRRWESKDLSNVEATCRTIKATGKRVALDLPPYSMSVVKLQPNAQR